jgi:hypothetical protein
MRSKGEELWNSVTEYPKGNLRSNLKKKAKKRLQE